MSEYTQRIAREYKPAKEKPLSPSDATACSALARAEFSELLKMPQPKTDRDYRRAILMAYVMGQVSQFDEQNAKEHTTPRNEA